MFRINPSVFQKIGTRNLISCKSNTLTRKNWAAHNFHYSSAAHVDALPSVPSKPLQTEANSSDHPFEKESFILNESNNFFHNVATEAFAPEIVQKLTEPIDAADVEVKPDGIIYFPEIKYRKRLNEAFGPGGWAMIPLGPHSLKNKRISREYALFCNGRYVSQARGEQEFFHEDGIPTATEGCKSNALMRCCKDLGICWELWDPRFIRDFKKQNVVMVQGTHYKTGQTKWLWKRKDATLDFPYKEFIKSK